MKTSATATKFCNAVTCDDLPRTAFALCQMADRSEKI